MCIRDRLSSASDGRVATGTSGTGTWVALGSVTWPTWNSATSRWPRDTLRCKDSSRPGSSVVASSSRSDSSGLSTFTVLRRTSSGAKPNASQVAGEVNGKGSTST